MGQAREMYRRYLTHCAAASLLFLLAAACAAQTEVKPKPEIPFSEDLKKYPGLLTELAHLVEALKSNVPLPPVRTQSRLIAEVAGSDNVLHRFS
jgi:hypothetical protein